MDIPFPRLGIPEKYRVALSEDAPRETRLALTGAPVPAEAELGLLYALACIDDGEVHERAVARLRNMQLGPDRLTQGTHPKVLELLVSVREDLDDQIAELREANSRTMQVIAARADSILAERIADDHDRLLLTPEVLRILRNNPRLPAGAMDRAVAFMRMNRMESSSEPVAPAMDLEAEIAAALGGQASPHLLQRSSIEAFDVENAEAGTLKGFNFDFADDGEFSLDLLEDREGGMSDEERITIAKKIAGMTPGKKIKLAYLGNKETRAILIRDRSKSVAAAVVKSGRLTDAEVVNYAGNRNLAGEILREIASNKEWIRKYPVQVALVNNPRCPINISVSMVDRLMAKDLAALARNRNVSSVVFQKAEKMTKMKGHNK